MRGLVVGLVVSLLAVAPPHARAQSSQSSAYLRWTAAEAERIGKGMRVNGRVGGAFDLRVIHTERSYNYKLRATWLTTEVIQATARLAQLSERLSDEQTESLVREASAAGEAVFLVEIDPREGSGIIPPDWSVFLGPAGSPEDGVAGRNEPALEGMKALKGVYRRDYNYERFWVTVPLKRTDGSPLFPPGTTAVELTVRIHDKEGRVTWPLPAHLR